MEKELKELASKLFDIGAINFGEFETKVGIKTPVYIDLRVLIAHPKIMVSLLLILNKRLSIYIYINGNFYTQLIAY